MLRTTKVLNMENEYTENINELDTDNKCFSLESMKVRERKRRLHTEAEQRRRNAIKVNNLFNLIF